MDITLVVVIESGGFLGVAQIRELKPECGCPPGENAPSTQQAVAKLNAFLNESA